MSNQWDQKPVRHCCGWFGGAGRLLLHIAPAWDGCGEVAYPGSLFKNVIGSYIYGRQCGVTWYYFWTEVDYNPFSADISLELMIWGKTRVLGGLTHLMCKCASSMTTTILRHIYVSSFSNHLGLRWRVCHGKIQFHCCNSCAGTVSV